MHSPTHSQATPMRRDLCPAVCPALVSHRFGAWSFACMPLMGLSLALVLGWPQARAQAVPTAPEPLTPPPVSRPQTPALESPSVEQALQTLRRQAGSNGGSAPSSSTTPPAMAPESAPARPAPRVSSRATPRSSGGADVQARDAAWLLGLLALHGIAMPADPAQAQQWFARARQAGHPLAAAGLAWCAIDGCSGPPQPAAARPWIAQLRATDPARALYLEWWVAARLAPLPIASPAWPTSPNSATSATSATSLGREASADAIPHRTLLLRAAQAGSPGALTELGLDHVAQGQLPAALERFRAASARSPAAARNAGLLASRMQDEDAIRANDAAPAGERSAAHFFAQAQRYHRGSGVPSNYAEAIRLYQVASASGSAPARRMLELIYSRPTTDGTVDIAWMQQLTQFDVTRSGSLRAALPAPGPQPYVRDPTPLYDMVPPAWRDPVYPRTR